MSINYFRRNLFCFHFDANFMSFHLTVILPRFGFQVLYLSQNPYAATIESGYKFHNKGARDLAEGEFLPVVEECIWKDTLLRRFTA